MRARCDRARFHEAEAKPQQRQHRFGILVKTGGKAEWIAEARPCDFDGKAWVIRAAILAGKTQ